MEDVSFNAHRLSGTTVEVTGEYVRAHTGDGHWTRGLECRV